MSFWPQCGGDRSTRREWLRVVAVLPAAATTGVERLNVKWDGDMLRFSAPQFHFIAGKPLEKLKNGAPVGYLWQVTVFSDAYTTAWRRVPGRFVVSYDLWEEKFSVTQLGLTSRSVSHLSARAAEAWCLENILVNSGGIDPDKPFWIRLDMRMEDSRGAAGVVGDAGINVTRLIELFSRPAGHSNPNWSAATGPLRLADLRRARGNRAG
jgi:hypothetical protein